MAPAEFQQLLLAWFDCHGRKDLPWQQSVTPYRVWLSEIMLQQTQVATVIPYFNRFMDRFPDVNALAAASLDEVLALWAGLGYYARARNLHRTAQQIRSFGGVFPRTVQQLTELPGIGRSTAGAIMSIAFRQSEPILDGNVKRVVARFHGIAGWSGERKVVDELWRLSALYTPVERVADYTQAMMDLGATLCNRGKPQCVRCPVAVGCLAWREGRTAELPTPKPRKILPIKQTFFMVLTDAEGRLLLEKRPPQGIWGGLWCFPEFAGGDELRAVLVEKGYENCPIERSVGQRHTFSHFHLDYHMVVVRLENPKNIVMEGDRLLWYKFARIDQLALPTPIARFVQQYFIEDNDG